MSMHRLGELADRMFNTPLAIHPRKCAIIVASLADRLGITNIIYTDGRDVRAGFYDDEDDDEFRKPAKDKGYDIIPGSGIAVIPVRGTLVQRSSSLRPYSGMMGYNSINQMLATALMDPEVKAIALDVDSPGGEVAGCFDLVDRIYSARGKKPIWAILSEHAYSAAYAIASACDRVIVPRTGGTGSVGVVTMHVDMSKALENDGFKVTFLTFGAQKADANQYEPLPAAVAERIQRDIDKMGELFVATVARNRKLSAANVRATEAGCFMGEDGVKAGLADAVMSPEAAFQLLYAELN